MEVTAVDQAATRDVTCPLLKKAVTVTQRDMGSVTRHVRCHTQCHVRCHAGLHRTARCRICFRHDEKDVSAWRDQRSSTRCSAKDDLPCQPSPVKTAAIRRCSLVPIFARFGSRSETGRAAPTFGPETNDALPHIAPCVCARARTPSKSSANWKDGRVAGGWLSDFRVLPGDFWLDGDPR